MVARRSGPSLPLTFFCAVWVWLVIFSTPAFAQVADQVAAHLAAGEFGPARTRAEQAAGPERDALLAQIAAAQARGGALTGSFDSLAEISDDRVRAQAVADVRQANNQRWLGRGGGVTADFQPLIDLLTSTIEPDSWQEVGGPGSIEGFEGGVFVNPRGLLKRLPPQTDRSLSQLRLAAAAEPGASGSIRRTSVLRKVSLTRLEREAQLRHAIGLPPTGEMLALAGITRIKYLFVYPETGEVVIAGPAGDWTTDPEGKLVSVAGGKPVLRLDDLVVVLRNAASPEGRFGCSINPRKESLAAAQAVNNAWAARGGVPPGKEAAFVSELQQAMGRQDIVVYGIDPRTRAARTLVEADYRMKLVGMGLEPGAPGVVSYLDSLAASGGDGSMSVLRWWFTLNYQALRADAERTAFELHGPGVQVLSENELLTAQGERVHTGKSEEPTLQFAQSFTKQFELLATKYPIYADLRNIFDLALVAAVIESHDVAGQARWRQTHFGAEGGYQPQLETAPSEVDSVINHRLIRGKQLLVGVSGGVKVNPRELAATTAVKTDDYGLLPGARRGSQPPAVKRAWWWD